MTIGLMKKPNTLWRRRQLSPRGRWIVDIDDIWNSKLKLPNTGRILERTRDGLLCSTKWIVIVFTFPGLSACIFVTSKIRQKWIPLMWYIALRRDTLSDNALDTIVFNTTELGKLVKRCHSIDTVSEEIIDIYKQIIKLFTADFRQVH